MGKYDNYSVEDCNKCLAELNESFEKLTKQFEAKEIKRFQYNFNRKSNAKQVNEVKARLAELTDKICEKFMQFPTEEEKDAYIKENGLEKDVDYKDKGINAIELLNEGLFGPSDEVIADSKAKGLYTEDVNPDLYVYEYYSTEEDAEATVAFLAQQGRKAEIRKEGEEYAVLTSTSTEDLLEDVVDVMWSAVCSGDTNFVKNAYNKDIIKPNTRYHRFDADNSFIMGALRNKNFEMAELLKSFGEKILKAELPEYKRIMAEREYEDETIKTAMEESKSVTETAIKYVVKKDGNVIDGFDGDTYFSNADEAIDVAKEHTGAYVERYYYKNEQDAEAREIPEDRFVVWAPEEEYEDYEDIDAEEETISLLDIALKEVPQVGVEDWGKDNELYFVADTVKLFEALKELEVEIPKSYYENADADDWSNGIDDYLVSIGIDPEEGKGDNTYNWNAPLTHDVNMTRYEAPNDYYVKLEIHRSGDVRGNYTTSFLMRFDADYDFFETVSDVCSEECFRELKHNDKTYIITPDFWSEYVNISCVETDETWDEVYCTDLEGLEEIIKRPVDESKEKPLTEEVEYMSKAEYDELDDDFKGTVAELIQTAELRGEDPEETRQLYKDLGYDENDKTVVVLDKTGGTVLKPVKLTEAPTEEDAEYKRLCQEIEFQAEENNFTLTEEDVKAIADKMIADKFFFNHDIMADDKDENAWEEINSLIVSAIEAHPNKIEESANDKVINAVRQGLSKHDVDNLSVDEDEEGNISVMYHSDKDSFPVVQNICKVVDIDKATLIPELDKLDVGKTFLTEDWEDMEDVKTFKFTIVLDTSDPEADIFKKLTHHMEYLLDFDESQYSLSVFDVTTRTEDGAVVVEGEIEVDEDIDADELTEELTYLVVEDGWEDVEMSLASVSVKELK